MNQKTDNKKYFCLEPSRFRLDGGAMFGIIPRPLWSKLTPPDEQNRIDLALRLLLIRQGDRVVLIDTGIGDYHGEKFDQMFDVRTDKNPLEMALAKIDLVPNDVTDLVLSHLHFDHIGGIGKRVGEKIAPVFEKARCYIHQKHYEYAHKPTPRDGGSFQVENFEPVIEYYRNKDQMIWLDGDDQGELISEMGLKFKTSFGHTPWMIHPYDDKVIYLADLIPTSHHIHIPWVMGYDIAAGETTKYKAEFLDFIVKNQLNVVYEHDPEFWGGTIEKNDKGRYVPGQRQPLPPQQPHAYPIL